jgi:hypothetical protein
MIKTGKVLSAAVVTGVTSLTSGTDLACFGMGVWFAGSGWACPGYGWGGYPGDGGYAPCGYDPAAPTAGMSEQATLQAILARRTREGAPSRDRPAREPERNTGGAVDIAQQRESCR